jgi:hypothetical protein
MGKDCKQFSGVLSPEIAIAGGENSLKDQFYNLI